MERKQGHNGIKRALSRKNVKRMISILLVLLMVISDAPIRLLEGLVPLRETDQIREYLEEMPNVKAEEQYDDIPAEWYATDGTVQIGNPTNLWRYSQAYYSHAATHENDVISIAFAEGSSQTEIKGFLPIGTEAHPFHGKIIIGEGTEKTLKINDAFFDYVYDSVEIVDTSDVPATFLYNRLEDNTGSPILAKHVKHDPAVDERTDGEGNPIDWNGNLWLVDIEPYVDSSAVGGTSEIHNFGGIIGEMMQGAKIRLDITDNNVRTEDSTYGNVYGTDDIGYVCQKMGQNSGIVVEAFSATNSGYGISTDNGHAGGVVGSMSEGAKLVLKCDMGNPSASVRAASGKYAGGIVGYNDGGTVEPYADATNGFYYVADNDKRRYTVANTIVGDAGAGGVFGYFRPAFTDGKVTFDVKLYDLTALQVDGNGSIGGLFGVLENTTESNSGIVRITDGSENHSLISIRHLNGEIKSYGGLIGFYKAKDSLGGLYVDHVSVTSSRSDGSYVNYGGVIGRTGSVSDATNAAKAPSYVSFEGVNATVTSGNGLGVGNDKTYGGLIANSGNSFVDAKNVTIASSQDYVGGGLIGTMGQGVLRLKGSTSFTGAGVVYVDPEATSTHLGQIVGYRDSALIYAQKDWILNRGSAVAADDIGAWGEVLRFDKITENKTGDVVTSTEEKLGTDKILTVDETTHVIEIAAHTISGSATTISTAGDFMKLALMFQLDASENPYVSFHSDWGETTYANVNTVQITLGGDIDLTGTGLTGLTRDNDTDLQTIDLTKCVYKGKLVGNENYTITLATGEPYGYRGGVALTNHAAEGNGKIYRHVYNGLFGIVDTTSENGTATVTDLNLAGNMDVCSSRHKATAYVGAYAGRTAGHLIASNAHVETAITHGGTEKAYVGGFTGEATAGIKAIQLTDGYFGSTIVAATTGGNSHADTCIGGVIGRVSHAKNEATDWLFQDVVLSGEVSNGTAKGKQCIGGLIAEIEKFTNANVTTQRKLTLDGVKTSSLTVRGALTGNNSSIGGLLGYSWLCTNVLFTDLDLGSDDQEDTCTLQVSNTSNHGNAAGLVYVATGKWTITDVKVNKLTLDAAAKLYSFGMLMNRGWDGHKDGDYERSDSSAIYVLLPASDCYDISETAFGGNFDAGVYDELVAYSAYYRVPSNSNSRVGYAGSDEEDLYVLKNGQGVVSIHTDGLVMDGASESKSYPAQTSFGKKPNPYTRYYYNLENDTAKDQTTFDAADAPVKLMSWGLHCYAHPSIQAEFYNGFQSGSTTVIPNATYIMTNYSWYPVDVEESVTINGTFQFANQEFEGSEQAKYDADTSNEYDRTSLYDTGNSITTQHFLLHAGLLHDVKADVTIGSSSESNVTLQGNTGLVKWTGQDPISGALICGKVTGRSSSIKTSVTVKGNLLLNGIHMHNYVEKTSDDDYAPLLINKAGSYVNLAISNVSTTDSGYTAGQIAATSLLGNIGNSSAEGVNVTFTNIKLDARCSENADNAPTDAAVSGTVTQQEIYHTTRSIFTKATLMNKYAYVSGSNGIYTFAYDADWTDNSDGTYTHKGAVTYGLELWDGSADGSSVPDNHDTGRNQYIGQEHKYLGSEKCVNPVDATASSPYDFVKEKYLPYVFVKYNETNKTYQIQVNHSAASLTGCGTYNDPYYIYNPEDSLKAGDQLETVEAVLRGTTTDTKFEIPFKTVTIGETDYQVADLDASWHDAAQGHGMFIYLGNQDTGELDPGYYLDGIVQANTVSGATELKDHYLTLQEMQTYLAGAYYLIGSNLTINSDEFKGLGGMEDYAVFRGVIEGGDNTIYNQTKYPLINNSYGSVVKNLTIQVQPSTNIVINGNQNAYTTTGNEGNNSSNGAYGGVIGRVMAGDNIIDKVTVNYSALGKAGSEKKIQVNEMYAQLAAVGGYVGVIVGGGVIFRNMTSIANDIGTNGLKNSYFTTNVATKDSDNSYGNKAPQDKMLESNSWLYVNPYVGRVIDGFAIHETTQYRPYENGHRDFASGESDVDSHGHVTLQNGAKHYSITDVNPNLDKLDVTVSSSNLAIEVPNAQAFYLMSIMINDGMSICASADDAAPSNALGYYHDYAVARHASYTKVADAKTADMDSAAYKDYKDLASQDKYWNASTKASYAPYLIKKYTKDKSNDENGTYPAKAMGQKKNSITLTGSDTYILPDGYKGIGNIYHSQAKYCMKLGTLEGNGNTISQNTEFRYYDENTEKVYYPATNSSYCGLGLFNYQANAANEYTYYNNLVLTGNVIAFVGKRQSATFEHVTYTTGSIDKSKYMCAGMLAAYMNGNGTIKNVALNDIKVYAPRNAGGLIGFSDKTINYEIEADAGDAYNSDGISVYSACSTGGLIGKVNGGTVKIDMHDHTFNLKEIVNECTNRNGNYYDFGVGGFIGMIRKGENSADSEANDYSNYVKNVIIGSEKKEQKVTCDDANIFTGGVIGILNKARGIQIENCTFYNLSVTSKFGAAGLVAFPTTYTPAKVINTHLLSPLGSEISSKTDYAGGLIGSSDPRGGNDGSDKFRFMDCSIEGYVISGEKGAGGVIGFRGAKSDSIYLTLNNISVLRCTIKSSGSAGGVIGEMNSPIQGYNVLVNDVSVEAIDESITNAGSICGRITKTSENVTYTGDTAKVSGRNPVLKIVGLSRQDITAPDTMLPAITGTCNNGSGQFGVGGYVVFADYTGKALEEDGYSQTFSTVNNANNVKASDGTSTVTDNKPYVTSSYDKNIDDNVFLTGDGIGYDTSIAYANSPIGKIIRDVCTVNLQDITALPNTTAAKRYAVAYQTVTAQTTAEMVHKLSVDGKYSTYRTEMGDTLADMAPDFPVLVIDDVNRVNTTNFINNYLRYLTNTSFNFAKQSLSDDGTAGDARTVFKINIGTCEWDPTEQEFKAFDSTAPNLINNTGNGTFYMRQGSYDNENGKGTGQFTLLDVWFYDPSQVPTFNDNGTMKTEGKVAYHLYVPIVIKKVLHYDFKASFMSGTLYRTLPYESIRGNSLVENIGNPVTMEVSWIYEQDVEVWRSLLYSGENLLRTYPKKIQVIDSTRRNLPAGAVLVLIDPNDGNKHYYGTAESVYTTGTKNFLNLNSFKENMDGTGNAFQSIDFNEFFDITVAAATAQTETKFSQTDDPSEATIKVGSAYYKPDESGDKEITIAYKSGVSNSQGFITENYYISFFTDEDDTSFYHLEFCDQGSFDVPAYPSLSNAGIQGHTHLLTGDIYENVFDIDDTNSNEKISLNTEDFNNTLEADLSATVYVKPSARATIKPYLGYSSVTVYQSFFVYLKKQNSATDQKKGILTDPTISEPVRVTINGGEPVTVTPIISSNYIEIRSNRDISSELQKTCSYDSTLGAYPTVEIASSIKMAYNNDQTIPIQFPTRDPSQVETSTVIGTRIGGSSNISSNSTGAAYSKTLDEKWGKNNRLYYCTTNASAELYLNSDDALNDYGEYYQLGINALDFNHDKEEATGSVKIKASAIYNVHGLTDSVNAESMKITIHLRKKADYTENGNLNINTYITDLILEDKAFDAEDDAHDDGLLRSASSTATTFVYVVNDPLNVLDYDAENMIYTIPLSFYAYSGENDGFEGIDSMYSNYMIWMEVELYYGENAVGAIDGSEGQDHLIYTNTRIVPTLVE